MLLKDKEETKHLWINVYRNVLFGWSETQPSPPPSQFIMDGLPVLHLYYGPAKELEKVGPSPPSDDAEKSSYTAPYTWEI